MNKNVVSQFKKMIDVNLPIIYIEDFDFVRVDEVIFESVGKDSKIVEWNPGTGRTKIEWSKKEFEMRSVSDLQHDLVEFLKEIYSPNQNKPEPNPAFYILREIQDYIDEPAVKTLLALIAQRRIYDPGYDRTIIISSSVRKVPVEIEKYVSYLDIWPMPASGEERDVYIGEIERIIREHGKENKYEIKDEDKEELMLSLTGMSPFDIDRMIDMAMSNNGSLESKDKEMLQAQKKTMVKQSGVLELIDTPEKIDSIGGMKALKRYLENKAKVYKDLVKAQEYGVSKPKGVFIVGMPGCGKSLCAKASAALFECPLLKLDMGSLMGKYVGESEANLRKAIKISEAVAPSVLWIDEIEKAFSGVGSDDNGMLRRMFGYFLSWMQDKKSSVYVIATANNANNLPPELKRKGRFDEIYCVNLPTKEECEAIFKVHLGKKKDKSSKWKDIDTKAIAEKYAATANRIGCNGADIESIINESVEKWFLSEQTGERKTLDEIVGDVVKTTISINMSCKKQIEDMRKIFSESNFKDASTGKISGNNK